jgi:UDP-N-acetylglucosamine 3-dehydrogenase
MSKTRVCVIGYGAMGKQHSRVISSLSEFELAGVHDPDLDLLSNLSLGAQLNSLEEVFCINPDYVVIAAPTILHGELAEYFITRKINLLIEKPMAHSSNVASKLVNLAKKNGIFGGIGHIERFNPASIKAKELIRNGLIGEIVSISTVRQGPLPARIKDVGVVFDLATHDIDLAQWLANSTYERFNIEGKLSEETGHESLIFSTGFLKSGCIVSHSVNWISPVKIRKVSILGTHGALEINTLNSELLHFESASSNVYDQSISKFTGNNVGTISNLSFDKEEALVLEHKSFRDHLLGRSSEVVTFEEGFEIVKIAEAMRSQLKQMHA